MIVGIYFAISMIVGINEKSNQIAKFGKIVRKKRPIHVLAQNLYRL